MAAASAVVTILLVCMPEWGHLNPFINLASSIQRNWDISRGRLVLSLASMEQARAAAERHGITFVSLGQWRKEEAEELAQNLKITFGGSTSFTERLSTGATAIMDMYGVKMGSALLLHLAQANSTGSLPDVIVTDGLTSAGLDAAEVFHTPLAVVWPFPINAALLLAGYNEYNMHEAVPLEFMGFNTPENAHVIIRKYINPVFKRLTTAVTAWTFGVARNRVRQKLGLQPLLRPLLRKPDGSSSGVVSSSIGVLGVQPAVPRALYLAGMTWELNVERQLPPSWHVVGPQVVDYSHNFPPQLGPDDQAVQDFLQAAQDAGEPVVFAAAGTMTDLSLNQVSALVDAFTSLTSGPLGDNQQSPRVRVLWSLKPDSQQLLPGHLRSCSSDGLWSTTTTNSSGAGNSSAESSSARILVLPWVKQTAVLAHPQTKVFITHGGQGSVHEALALGQAVPLAVPFSNGADHVTIGQQLMNRGLGLMLKTSELAKPGRLAGAIKGLLQNPSYAERVAAVSRKWRSAGYGPQKAAELLMDFVCY